jgi:hypothetical protein
MAQAATLIWSSRVIEARDESNRHGIGNGDEFVVADLAALAAPVAKAASTAGRLRGVDPLLAAAEAHAAGSSACA